MGSNLFKKKKNLGCLLVVLLLLNAHHLLAQKDSTYKNSLKYNVTNAMVFGYKSAIFGYERIINKNRSFSVTLGKASYPLFYLNENDSLTHLKGTGEKENGFHISGDYRHYILSENKFGPPRGLYWGPFYSFNYFHRTNDWEIISSMGKRQTQSEMTLFLHTIGVELGYQVILKDRWCIDMILLGPGLSVYNLKAGLTGASDEENGIYREEIYKYLTAKYPGYGNQDHSNDFEKNGVVRNLAYGFRYVILVGYRF